MNNRLLHTPEGVRDIYGKEYARKLAVEQKLQNAIHCFGYEDIQTPSIEFFDVFSKEIGTTPSKELYKFFDKEGNTLVLRPDFTPSIARCAAKYFMEEKVPLRFSYNGNTFTNTSNLQGKLKEVTQMGAELIGDPSVEADAEVISMVIEALKSTGLTRFQVTIGEVDYFRGLCEEAGLDEDTEKELRSCISGKNFFAAQELLEQKQIPEPYHSILLKLADMFENIESLEDAKSLVKNERSLQAIARLEKLKKRLEQYGVAEYITFDLGMLSKYQYYTGVVFKAYTYGIGDAVVKGECSLALLFCGTGVGISIAANKVNGIRACCCSDVFSAKYTRMHNDANALCMGGRVVGPGLAVELVDAFLAAGFEGGRHARRVEKLAAIEARERGGHTAG